MSLLSRLFGGSNTAPDPVSHEGFSITPASKREGSTFRLGARIEKEIGGETRFHDLIRADTFESESAANDAALAKAKMLIDQMGEKLFD